MRNNELFQNAALIQLSTSCWIGCKTLKQGQLRDVGNPQWLRGRKLLIKPEQLNSIRFVIQRGRQLINTYSLPFPITGLYLVPKDCIEDVDGHLNLIKQEYWEKVCEFAAHYEYAREEARQALGDLFNEADYPEDIQQKFRFEWRFLLLNIPGKTSVLSPEVYAREKQKFEALMADARTLACTALRKEFADIVEHLVERLTSDGKPKTLRTSILGKLDDFLASFGDRNLFDDSQLQDFVEQTKTIVSDIRSGNYEQSIQHNELLGQRICNDMRKVKHALDSAIEEMPRRKIRIEKTTQFEAA